MKHNHVFIYLLILFFLAKSVCFALDKSTELEALKENLLKAPDSSNNTIILQKISNLFFERKDYSGFVDYLYSVKDSREFTCPELIYYYISLTRVEELRYLDSIDDWGKYYELVYDYHQEIDESAKKIQELCPNSELSVDAQYLNWLVKSDEETKDKLTAQKILTQITADYARTYADVKKLKEVADALENENNPKAAEQVYNIYIGQVIENLPRGGEEQILILADDVFISGNYVLAKILYHRFFDLIKDNFPKDRLKERISKVALKFQGNGWSEGKDGEFAEELYSRWEDLYGMSSFDEHSLYNRADNLYKLKNYDAVIFLYEQMIEKFSKSEFIPEVCFRSGIIYLYQNKNIEQAEKCWNRVLSDYKESYFAAPSAYQLAVLTQHQGERNAVPLYKTARMLSRDKMLTKKIDGLIDQESKNSAVEYEMLEFMNTVFNTPQDLSTISTRMSVSTAKTFAGNLVNFSVVAQDYGLGSVQPAFNFQWGGDIGAEQSAGESFNMIYETSGIKFLNVIAEYENRRGWDFQDLIVYELRIVSNPPAISIDKEIALIAEIIPPIVDLPQIDYNWEVTPGRDKAYTGKTVKYKFDTPGLYKINLKISFESKVITTQTIEVMVTAED
ncbi:MAG: hypothetical protein ABH952_00665 [Candidatus Omnitrophota bacterium]